jgi:hypothetical protein
MSQAAWGLAFLHIAVVVPIAEACFAWRRPRGCAGGRPAPDARRH